jgi:hypothetical protein
MPNKILCVFGRGEEGEEGEEGERVTTKRERREERGDEEIQVEIEEKR